ncbi:LysM peptidoglycan-binding domain-containing protein [uncultured Amnibacterium sp.]|uniref:LysM peptidoglycan-binding domain-containing protein n=1 Tax=uncultured Amnibacterium sp. TaxID=1631851 RepID=UPI0035CB8E0F
MSSMLTEGGSAPVAAPVVRGRHLAPRPPVRRLLRATPAQLVGSFFARSATPPAEAHHPHSTPRRAQPAQGTPAQNVAAPDVPAQAGPASTPPRAGTAAGRASRPSLPTGAIPIVLVAGESVADIAARFGLSTASLLALNGLSWRTPIEAGTTLFVRAARSKQSPAPAPAAEAPHHVVMVGDTVQNVAAVYGVAPAAILLANGLSRGAALMPGRRLIIPTVQRAATGPVLPLTDELRANVRTIVGAGRTAGVADDGLVIALTAAIEDADQATGGLFGRRARQGLAGPRDVADPSLAAQAFFGGPASPLRHAVRGLLDVPGWQLMSVPEAASAVQGGAVEDYARWERCARAWLIELDRAQ